MRLSEILKSSDSRPVSFAPESPVKKSPPPAKKAATPVSVTPIAPLASTPVAAPAIDIEKMKQEIRQQLEKEFQAQINRIQAETLQGKDEVLKAEEEKFFARTEMIKKEKLQLAAQLEELKRQNAELQKNYQGFEQAKKEMLAAQEKMTRDFQEKIARAEEERQKLASESPAVLEEKEKESLKRQIEEELDQAMSDKIRNLEKNLKEKEKQIQSLAAPKPPAQKSTATGFPYQAPSLPKEKPREAVINPEAAREAQHFYDQLVHTCRGIFDQIKKKQSLDFSLFLKTANEFTKFSSEHQDELIGRVVEPYPAENMFLYHTINTVVLAVLLGMDLNLSDGDLSDLALASALHDIGLLDCHEELNYPKELTKEMKAEVLSHPAKGAELVAGHVSEAVQNVILQHHELSNGKGYPKGLNGPDIHLFSKIINIADSFEAMIHTRPYRLKPMEVNEAVKEMIERERGLHDRDVMKALLSRVGLYPIKSYVELSNKQVARILRQNRQFPISPVVQIEFDEEGNKIQPPLLIDLSRNQMLHITGPLKTVHSYSKERLVQEQKKSSQNHWVLAKEVVPILLIILILGLLAYWVIKI